MCQHAATWIVSPGVSSSTPLRHRSFDHESTVSVVEACAFIILPRVMWQIELLLATCAITCITKLTDPVMSRMRSQVYLLFSVPKLVSLHTTPYTGLSLG